MTLNTNFPALHLLILTVLLSVPFNCFADISLNTDPAGSNVNEIDMTLTVFAFGNPFSDTQTVTIQNGSPVNIDPVWSNSVLQTMEHTGGQLQFSDSAFQINFGFGQILDVEFNNLEAAVFSSVLSVTPDGNSGGSYDLNGQQMLFNQGTVTYSGAASGSMDYGATPGVITLQATPSNLTATNLNNGSHEIVDTINVDTLSSLGEFGGNPTELELVGNIVSRATIPSSLISIPEPASTCLMIGLFASVLKRRKR